MAGKEASHEEAFPIVGVGASAGGIEAFNELLKALSDNPGMAFVFVLHQDPKHESNLAQVIARATTLPVEVARDGTKPEIDHVYVLPPDAEARLEDGKIRLSPRVSGAATIDKFFRSLAEDLGSRAISVVLSGSASDGALGTKEVKAEGGITFAQNGTARMDSMPQAAIAAGFVDFVLPPDDIANELQRIARHDYLRRTDRVRLPEADLTKLFTIIHQKHDIDFTHYKPATIERRIRRRMVLRKANTLEDYLKIVREDSGEVEQLYGDILIKVTGFFRDPEVFAALGREVFPEFNERRGNDAIRAWVPGCATGEEVYSLAIALLEASEANKWPCPIQIFGTDVSDSALERARAGRYPETIVTEVSGARLKRYFSKVEGGYRINKNVRDCCIFARQNVTKDPPFSKLDLISCRNVMIYFGSALQRRVLSIFNYALRPDGFLLLGSSETVGNFSDLFGVIDRKNKIYRKKTILARPVQFDMVKTPELREQRADVDRVSPAPNAIFREADRVLLDRFTPAGVLINENLDVLQFRGRTSRYLEIPAGTASFSLLKMAREGLLADLRAAIHAARKKDAPDRREGLRVKTNDHTVTVNIEVIPFVGASKERFLLVLFEEPVAEPEKKAAGRKKKSKASEADSKPNDRLKRELEATREYLQSIIEEQEAMNEELRSANEEIQSSNEELQSTNEELETAKEELQSTNEELTTLNEELEIRNQELARLNNDLINLLSSVEIPILMLNGDMRIRRFNPIAQRKFNLTDADVGRPLTDINMKLPLPDLDSEVKEVIDTLKVREMEVRDKNGRVQSLRIRPYRTSDNKIDGAVLVLVDVEEFRRKGAGLAAN